MRNPPGIGALGKVKSGGVAQTLGALKYTKKAVSKADSVSFCCHRGVMYNNIIIIIIIHTCKYQHALLYTSIKIIE